MKTLTEFVREAGITSTATRADANPHMDTSEGSHVPMDHWRVVLRMGRSRLTVPFSMGMGHNGKAPQINEVLDCLASDASGIENARDFDEWASEYGYSTDSRKAERTFRTCQRQAVKLKRFLGDSAYDALLWHTERE